MKRFAIVALFTVAGCTTNPKVALPPPTCSDGLANLRFDQGRTNLDRTTVSSLEWVARIVAHCDVTDFSVYGLPSPSTRTAEGRRALSVAQALEAKNMPSPTYDNSDDDARLQPVLAFKAKPRSH